MWKSDRGGVWLTSHGLKQWGKRGKRKVWSGALVGGEKDDTVRMYDPRKEDIRLLHR